MRHVMKKKKRFTKGVTMKERKLKQLLLKKKQKYREKEL